MGRILTDLKVINRIDQANAEDGRIPSDQVRSIQLKNVLVDTGATTLCLPSQVILTLGLKLLKEVDVATANGFSKARIFQDAKIALMGREGTFECLELPGGRDPLLGVIPLEALGIELDLQHQQLRLLPDESRETYLTILSCSIDTPQPKSDSAPSYSMGAF
ncbi:aspartyl protease family protein [Spirulina subsalsa]|uniref:aspartyl protease family protein n=1 Tax=Spirulina subsalsa TaxID=54311 RepID=UPI0003745F47